MAIGVSEAETFWVEFLRRLKRRGLAGVKLVISDAHEGIKGAVARVFRATWQRCRVHFMRNALAHAGKNGRRVVSAFIATAFAQDHADATKAQWRQVADQVRTKLPKLAARLDEAEEDVLAYMSFPRSTGPRSRAKSGAAAASPAGLPDQMTRPQVRRPCAGRLLAGRDRAAERGAASDLQRVWRGAPRREINVIRPRVLIARVAAWASAATDLPDAHRRARPVRRSPSPGYAAP
jgi:hypothetical protein